MSVDSIQAPTLTASTQIESSWTNPIPTWMYVKIARGLDPRQNVPRRHVRYSRAFSTEDEAISRADLE